MLRTMLWAKLHRVTVTGSCLDYEGSIAICPKLLEVSGIVPNERVDVYNVTTGARFSTYAIAGNDQEILVNGAAARLAMPGDLLIIAAYAQMTLEEMIQHQPRVVLVDRHNVVHEVRP
ncbi:aspartate 1-decarboxylase [Thermodesulfomicrobium sp. WS]|uniref:aspartate 1-decarboxylase n=1 Tax=Thermodesulfomicrobium sp. WS TaxID=3004129 RepID=UPI00249303E1|nr:aspartate 1-decarboxylase [Thermodesulfomicrobium sp. WS]BDV01288.1 aspartate 1-decarboxylase [Thermodesulfomicrobium sp. WS]